MEEEGGFGNHLYPLEYTICGISLCIWNIAELWEFCCSFWNHFGILGISLLFAVMKVNPSFCLCPVLLCLCFLERGYEASHFTPAKVISRSHNATRNHNQTKDGETEVHHRPKRGWIWNQFFVLEEHIGPEAQYVGKVSIFPLEIFQFSYFVIVTTHINLCNTACNIKVFDSYL